MEGQGAATAQLSPRTVEEVFRDFKCRRAGIVKALTTGLSLVSSSFLCWKFDFVLLLDFLYFLCVFVVFLCADVADFYEQCDPGEVSTICYLFIFYFGLKLLSEMVMLQL